MGSLCLPVVCLLCSTSTRYLSAASALQVSQHHVRAGLSDTPKTGDLCLQVHDRSGVQSRDDGHKTLSPEVALLQDVFPTASPEALINALSVSDNNVEIAKQV